mgnify:CR=1 FL=1
MPATNSIPLALSFMEVGCKTNHPYYGSPLLIYINLPPPNHFAEDRAVHSADHPGAEDGRDHACQSRASRFGPIDRPLQMVCDTDIR